MRRRQSLLWRLAMASGVLAALWLAGFLWFVWTVAALRPPPPGAEPAPEAIVVLTGGAERVETGLRLLAAGPERLLLVSGVHVNVTLADLARLAGVAPGAIADRVTLGRAAATTRGNAAETAAWARAQGVRSLRLVTAGYHMPRALLELRRALPEARLVPHPVSPAGFEPGAFWRSRAVLALLAGEYGKYLLARIGLAREGQDAALAGGPAGGAASGPGAAATPGGATAARR